MTRGSLSLSSALPVINETEDGDTCRGVGSPLSCAHVSGGVYGISGYKLVTGSEFS